MQTPQIRATILTECEVRDRLIQTISGAKLPAWAEDKAREIARDLGWDYYVVRENWLAFAKDETAKGNPPKNAGAAFVAYCKKAG